MTFRLPLCNVRQITEWVQQELICPGDWLGDWAIVHVFSEAGRSLKWASEWRRRRADVMKMNGGSPAPRRASCWADRWWTAATCNTNHSDDNTTSAQKKLFYTSHFTFNIFTLLLRIKNMLHDVFQNPEFVCFYASATVLREFLHIFFFFFFCDLMASRSREHIIDIQFWHKGQHGLEDELIRLWRSKVYNQEVKGLWSGHYSTPQLRNTSMMCAWRRSTVMQ